MDAGKQAIAKANAIVLMRMAGAVRSPATDGSDVDPNNPDNADPNQSCDGARSERRPPPTPKTGPMRVTMDGDQLEVSATLEDADAVDRLIAILEANKALLPPKN